MWDNEAERVGLQRCTPLGYFIYGLGDLLGAISLLSFLFTPLWLAFLWWSDSISFNSFWPLLLSIFLIFLRLSLGAVTWTLASKRGFRYDPETRTAHWIEGDEPIHLHYSDIVDEDR